LRVGHGARLASIGGERVPADRIRPAVEPERFCGVVDRRQLLVRDVGILGHPEEVLCHQLGERGAILLLRDLGEPLAETVEARIIDRSGKRDGNRLVGTGGRARRLGWRWGWRLGWGWGWGGRLSKYRSAGKHGRQREHCRQQG